ncbi:tyrosine-type recombinase/integrase [Miltoncostaea oceani]|uniref:tyrosine-type recombinase/integrase n=1 Tax=Miltoncostaea oceani TaxID=2843216 RepID=UPI001C3E0323|nr:site-specific integrase [Miltoncostaea oceani]
MAAPYERTTTPGVYRRGSRYVVTFTDPSGRRRKRAATTLAEARLLKSSLAADVARGEFRESSRARFEDYAREWVRTYEGRTSRGIRPETIAEYDRDLQLHVIPVIGRRRLSEIEQRDLKALARHLTDKGLAPATVRIVMAPVRALFATAVEEGLLRVNPAAGLRLGAGAKLDPTEKRRALDEGQLARLIEETPERWRLIVRFLAQTGLRVGELIALRWEDVDLGTRRVNVRRRLRLGRLDTPKSSYGIRQVPISTRLAQDLWRHRAGADDEALVFLGPEDRQLRPEFVLRSIVKPAAARAGVPWAGVHTLRHTCASILFRSGWNAKQVQVVLGHHSPAFTLATYVHLIPDDLPEPRFAHDEDPGPAGTHAAEPQRTSDGSSAPRRR